MKRDRDTLREVGEALYGPLWQSVLSRELKIADRTMRRWAGGQFPVPEGVWAQIATLCSTRGDALRRWAERLG